MPSIQYGNKETPQTDNRELKSYKYKYKYPRNLDLRPWTKTHMSIVDKVMRIARESAEIISNRFDSWNKIDETMTTYVDLTDKEVETQYDDHRKPVSIIYPYSYAILETILGYLLAAYMQDPIFRYEGEGGEDVIGAMLLEKIIAKQCDYSKVILNFHTLFRDCLCYGFGVVGTGWDVIKGYSVVRQEEQGFLGSVFKKTKKLSTVFEGNYLFNIDPYLCLPDPNQPIGNAQKSETFGWIDRTNLMSLLDEEKDNKDLFNVRYLKHKKNRETMIYNTDDSGRNKKSGADKTNLRESNTFNNTDVITMIIKLIPNDWGLSSYTYPEHWMFKVAADSILIDCAPLRNVHNQLPIGVAAPNFDGYSVTPISNIEVLYGLQHTLDWMFNAHVANVRKAINDTLIVDPYMVNVSDLTSPKAGGIVRTRKPVWGRGVGGAVEQLRITDVTRGHMADSEIIKSAMDRVGGANSAMSGELRRGGPERLTGKEFQGTQQGGYTRMERLARLIGEQCFKDIGMQFAANTQQYMSNDAYIKTVGEYEQTLIQNFGKDINNQRLKVSPFDMLINYDVKVRDGTIPGSNYSGIWGELFKIIGSSPELQQNFDLPRIFMYIAEQNGAKNVHDFVRVKQVADETVQQQTQAGNMIPLETYMQG